MITLREITPDNWVACIKLSVAEGQKPFVASNVISLAQAKVFPAMVPQAVYAGEALVGFVMYGIDTDDGNLWIYRLMIDEKAQGKGYGRAAMQAVMARLRGEGHERVYLSYAPENTAAEALYESLGFARTGKVIESEHQMVCSLEEDVK